MGSRYQRPRLCHWLLSKQRCWVLVRYFMHTWTTAIDVWERLLIPYKQIQTNFTWLLINSCKWSLIKCTPVMTTGWLKLDRNTSRSSAEKNERGTKGAANPVLAAYVPVSSPTEQTLTSGHTSITKARERRVKRNHMMKVEDMHMPFPLCRKKKIPCIYMYICILILSVVLVLLIFEMWLI